MGEERKFVKIYNDFMNDVESYNHREQFYYLVIKGLQNNMNKVSSINIDMMAGVMGVNIHSKNRTAIKETLLSMEEKGLLLLYKDIMATKHISVSDTKVTSVYYARLNWEGSGRGFTKIYYPDLLKFIGIDDKHKDLLFVIYFNIAKRIFDSESSLNYSFVTIDKIEAETGINRKTIMGKIAILMELKILYCHKVNEGAEKDKNYYCRWEDQQKMFDELKMEKEDK